METVITPHIFYHAKPWPNWTLVLPPDRRITAQAFEKGGWQRAVDFFSKNISLYTEDESLATLAARALGLTIEEGTE